jgi:hypothetical protein
MKTIIPCFSILLLLLTTTCRKDEDPRPDANYIGLLKLEYSRTFPEFTAVAVMEVEIDKSGEVYISEPDQVDYSGESEMDLEGGRIKMNETGNITITSLSGAYKEINGMGYLSVNASTLIDGTQTTWGWDDDYGWILVAETPFTLEDPVDSPMNFNIDDAVIVAGGSQLGASIAVPPFGYETFTWTLGLNVILK